MPMLRPIAAEPFRDRQEMHAVKEFIRENIATIIHPDEHISEKAIALLEGHAVTDGLRTIDALIAATTLREDGTLVTANHKYLKKLPAWMSRSSHRELYGRAITPPMALILRCTDGCSKHVMIFSNRKSH